MTMIEQTFMNVTPHALRDIAAALEAAKPRLVKVKVNSNGTMYLNPNCVKEIFEYKKGYIDIETTAGEVISGTIFKTAEEAITALGLN